LEILVVKEKAEDYTAVERFLIVAEGIRNDNVRKFVKEFNISHDTFYTWKKELMAQVNIIWGNHKTELKQLETLPQREAEINSLQYEIKSLNKEMKTLFRQLEQAHLKNFRMEILWSTVPDELNDKIPLKYYKTAVIQEVEKLQYINLEEACESLEIAVGTLRSWKRGVEDLKKKISDYPALCILNTILDNPQYGKDKISEHLYINGIREIGEKEIKVHRKESIRYIKQHNIRNKPLRYEFEDVNIAWATDFKYITINNKIYYFFKIIDDRSRLDICSSLVENATTEEALMLLEQAINITGTKPVILKTDRGTQFKSIFHEKLEQLGIYHLKSIPYYPRCNAKIERVFRDVEQNVCKNISKNITYEEAKQLLDEETIRHNEGSHMSLNGESPKSFYQKAIDAQSSIRDGLSSVLEKIEECRLFKTFKRAVKKVADFIPGTKIDVNVITYQM
jgi:hypothetical protein